MFSFGGVYINEQRITVGVTALQTENKLWNEQEYHGKKKKGKSVLTFMMRLYSLS